MDRETGIVFFVSGVVILIAGYFLVIGRHASRRYMIYRVVPMAGFFGAFGLGILANPNSNLLTQALIAAAQTIAIVVILHVLLGRRLNG